MSDNLARPRRCWSVCGGQRRGYRDSRIKSLPEFEQLLREAGRPPDFRDLSRSLKQNPSQLLYEPNYRGVGWQNEPLDRDLSALPLLCMTACSVRSFKARPRRPPFMFVAGRGIADRCGSAIPADLAVLKPGCAGLESDPDCGAVSIVAWTISLTRAGAVRSAMCCRTSRCRISRHSHLRTVNGDASVFASAYWLEIEVTDFQAEYASPRLATVHVHFGAYRQCRRSAHSRQFEADSRQPAAENP